jgi:Lon protease-like protein
MSQYEPSPVLPKDFHGVVRLFPLPNLVMFPNVMQPLHIFEPRYCEMLEDALRGDKLITMALLQPGWEDDYAGRPPISPVACIGRIVSHARDHIGRYNILLLGAGRAQIVSELPPERSFRRAEVKLLNDCYPTAAAKRRPLLQRKLLDAFRHFVPETKVAQQQFDQLLSNDIPLGMLTDIVSFTMSLDVAFKQLLLSECNVDRRATLLLEKLDTLVEPAPSEPNAPKRKFPPDFSCN